MAAIIFSSPLVAAGTASVTITEFLSAFSELHNKLIEAGLVATADSGQWDFTSTDTAPVANKTYGYRVYKLEDGNPLNIYLKIMFLGSTGVASGGIPWRLNVSVGLSTDGSGNLLPSTSTVSFISTSSYIGLNAASRGKDIPSLINVQDGFIGVTWKHGSVDPLSSYVPSAGDSPALVSFFVCRSTDDAGDPTSDGVALFCIAPNGLRYDTLGASPICLYMDKNGIETTSSRVSLAIGSDSVSIIDGKIPVYNVYAMTPEPRRISQLSVAYRIPGSKSTISDALLAPVGVLEKPFKIMSACWPADVFTGTGSRACMAMLWE